MLQSADNGDAPVRFSGVEVHDGSGKNLGRYAASWIACWPKPRRPSSTAALTWSTRCAPRGDQRICLRLFMRALTRWLTVPSAREVEIGLPVLSGLAPPPLADEGSVGYRPTSHEGSG